MCPKNETEPWIEDLDIPELKAACSSLSQEEQDVAFFVKGPWLEQWKLELPKFLGRDYTEEEDCIFRKIFGNDEHCLYNLRFFYSRARGGRNCVWAKGDHCSLRRFMYLARIGTLLQGPITIEDRLDSFKYISQLRAIAKRVGAENAPSSEELRNNILQADEEKVLEAIRSYGKIPREDKDFFIFDHNHVLSLACRSIAGQDDPSQ